MVKLIMRYFADRQASKIGWEGQYQRYLNLLGKMNRFEDLEKFRGNEYIDTTAPTEEPFILRVRSCGKVFSELFA